MLSDCRSCERTARDGGSTETASYREVVEEGRAMVMMVDRGGE